MKERLRVAIVGTGKRGAYMYGPIVRGLPDVELVGVWGRSESSVRNIGELLGVPWYTNMESLMREQAPQIGIVSVRKAANGEVGLAAVQSGLNVLVETPIAESLQEADAIIKTAEREGLKIEIAEQFHRRPLEQIKLRLIDSGLFGRIYSSFNDFAGHAYHGVSVLRSYLGFDARPLRVTALVREYPLAAHWSQIAGTRGPRTETQEHALIEFEGGRIGVFHWTSVGYDSALRWWRSSRFLGERGMGITVGFGLDVEEKLSYLAPGGEGPLFVTLQRVWERCDGGALVSIKAHTGMKEQPIVQWDSPFVAEASGRSVQWHDDEIGVASCLMSLVEAVRGETKPTYGAAQGRLDQEVYLAIQASAAQGGRPVELPLA